MRFSENKQQFKIGRIKYSLPESVSYDLTDYQLSFNFKAVESEWHFCYRLGEDSDKTLFDCYTKTFNQGIKALREEVKGYASK